MQVEQIKNARCSAYEGYVTELQSASLHDEQLRLLLNFECLKFDATTIAERSVTKRK
jgi:hypothetical protein